MKIPPSLAAEMAWRRARSAVFEWIDDLRWIERLSVQSSSGPEPSTKRPFSGSQRSGTRSSSVRASTPRVNRRAAPSRSTANGIARREAGRERRRLLRFAGCPTGSDFVKRGSTLGYRQQCTYFSGRKGHCASVSASAASQGHAGQRHTCPFADVVRLRSLGRSSNALGVSGPFPVILPSVPFPVV